MDEARAAFPREICGFVLRDWKILHVANQAQRDDSFRMDDTEVLEIYQDYGNQLIGIFHSHLRGSAHPSNHDMEYAPHGMRYWIVTSIEIVEWDMSDDVPKEVARTG